MPWRSQQQPGLVWMSKAIARPPTPCREAQRSGELAVLVGAGLSPTAGARPRRSPRVQQHWEGQCFKSLYNPCGQGAS